MLEKIPNPYSRSDCAGLGLRINKMIDKINELEKQVQELQHNNRNEEK